MELNADKCKNKITGSKAEVVHSFFYLGSYIIDDFKSIRDVKARFAMVLHKMTQMNTISKNRKISTRSKLRLLRT